MKGRWLVFLPLLLIISFSVMVAQIGSPGSVRPPRTTSFTPPVIKAPKLPVHAVSFPTTKMKLLDDIHGWAASKHRIFQTSDGGATWRDITPTDPHHLEFAPNSDSFASVFFLNPQTGWALLAYQAGAEDDQWAYDICITNDGGGTWTTQPLSLQGLDAGSINDSADIVFADSLHGFLNVGLASSAAFRLGATFATFDAGKSWTPVKNDPGHSGTLTASTPRRAWLDGDDGNLYRIDSGLSSVVSFPLTKNLSAATRATPGLPLFSDSEHGMEVVTYLLSADTDDIEALLYSTNDGGNSWHIDSSLSGLNSLAVGGDRVISTVVSSMWLVPFAPDDRNPTIAALSGHEDHYRDTTERGNEVRSISFASLSHGWVYSKQGLLSTDDGGLTWKNITPHSDESPMQPGASAVQTVVSEPYQLSDMTSEPIAGQHASSLATSVGAFGVSQHLGFETTNVMTVSNMQQWWNSSPFYDVGIYVNGGESHATDARLTASWVSQVQSQGWGIIPIWSSRQAPCACKNGANAGSTCTPFPHTFSSNPSSAYSQGQAEATKASQSVQSLGLDGAIIYLDIEHYDVPATACSAAVQAFVGGWVDGLHALSARAGVYGAPLDAATDFSEAKAVGSSTLSIPDDIWISSANKKATVWNLGHKMKETEWSDDQRLHQYILETKETWGGVTKKIDEDIVDGHVDTGIYVKTYSSSSYTEVTDPAAPLELVAINDGLNTATTNGLALNEAVGDIWGNLGYLYPPDEGSIDEEGIVYSAAGLGITLAAPNAYFTYAESLNHNGEVVGFYYTDINGVYDGITHSFLFSPKTQTYTNIDYPGATATFAYGINDAGWVVGSYIDSSNDEHCFMRKNGSFYSFDLPGGQSTCQSVNGQGVIVGNSSQGSYMIDAEAQIPTTSSVFTSLAQFYLPSAINNNGHIVGEQNAGSGEVGGWILYVDGQTMDSPGISLNDDDQVAGSVDTSQSDAGAIYTFSH